MKSSLMGLTFATSLSRQKISAIFRALSVLEGGCSDVSGLLGRLQFAIDKSISDLQFSGKEICDIVDALGQVLKKIPGGPNERYDSLSVVELKELMEDFEGLSRKR